MRNIVFAIEVITGSAGIVLGILGLVGSAAPLMLYGGALQALAFGLTRERRGHW
ncbi:MAG: hypothetical protein V4690_04265 [Patescibacteria group bacterium]